MMLDVMQCRAQSVAREQGSETVRERLAGTPVPYSLKYKARIGAGGHHIGELARQLCRAVLIDREMVDIAEAQLAFTQTIRDRLRRKPGPMLDSAKPLLLRRRDELAIAHNAGRAVGVESIDPENDHRPPALRNRRSRISRASNVSASSRCSA